VSSSEQVENADSVSALLAQVRLVIKERQAPHQITINQAQAHSLAGFIQRARQQAQADVTFAENTAELKLSYHLGRLLTDLYVNIEVVVRSAPGVNIHSVTIGSITVPGNWALKLAEVVSNWYTQNNAASMAINWITQVEISPDRILVDVAPPERLFQELRQINTGTDDAQTRQLKQQVVHYLTLLEALPPSDAAHSKTSLAYYLRAVMSEAAALTPNSEAVLENEAALLALAIYAGNYRFSRLIGSLSVAVENLPTSSTPAVLAGREDLSLHFIYSAAIKLLSEQGISVAVGEFKELMDRGSGGSGYSFTDLAADLSGAHFAALAVDPMFAQHVQQTLMEQPQESSFFPSVEGLDEGLDFKAFSSKYQAVDSPAYQQALSLINQRINQLPISRF
jgi:hypothetical protein